MAKHTTEHLVHIPAGAVTLEGELFLPPGTQGVVVFAHGSGSSRHSPRNVFVAQALQSAGLGTLLFDLLTRAEDTDYETRFDIALLTRRLSAATHWLHQQPQTKSLAIGLLRCEHRGSSGTTSSGKIGVRNQSGSLTRGTPGPGWRGAPARDGPNVAHCRG